MIVEISEAAEQDLIDGHRFYERQSTGLGDYFSNSVLADIESLHLYAGVHTTHFGYHRLLAKRFPFAVYYRVESDLIRVYAVLDCRRDSAWIRERLTSPMELIDTHCHLTFEPLAENVPGVIERSRAAGVTRWITIGTHLEDSRKAVELAGQYDNMYAAVGIHPHDAQTVDLRALEELKRLARGEKVVAIGETGLDFHYNFSKQPDQRRVFEAHLDIATELELPVVIHSRNAFDETMEILDRYGRGLKGVVFHCFSESAAQAQMVLDRGWFVSFTGVVTFKNAEATREAAKVVPLDRMMIETDCPYMSPEPVRKQKPNEPSLMVHTATFLAQLKGIGPDNLAQATTRTAMEFFHLSEAKTS